MGSYYVSALSEALPNIGGNVFILKPTKHKDYQLLRPLYVVKDGYNCLDFGAVVGVFSLNSCMEYYNSFSTEELESIPHVFLGQSNISTFDAACTCVVSEKSLCRRYQEYVDNFNVHSTLYATVKHEDMYKVAKVVVSAIVTDGFYCVSEDIHFIATAKLKSRHFGSTLFDNYEECEKACIMKNNVITKNTEVPIIQEAMIHINEVVKEHSDDIMKLLPEVVLEDTSLLCRSVLDAIKEYV